MARAAEPDVSPEELVANARALAPRLLERAERCERERRVPEESIQELKQAGLFRILQPRAMGGLELDFATYVRVATELGRGCASTAWVYENNAMHQLILALFPAEIDSRNQAAARYTELLSNISASLALPDVPAQSSSVWAQYTVRVTSGDRDRIAAALKSEGIPTAVYYPRPLHHQPAYRDCITATTGLAHSERLATEVLSLPMHPYLTEADQQRVCDAMRRALRA